MYCEVSEGNVLELLNCHHGRFMVVETGIPDEEVSRASRTEIEIQVRHAHLLHTLYLALYRIW